jgi:uncharacterized membrane protein
VLEIIRQIIVSGFFILYPYLVFRGMQEGIVWFAPMVVASLYFFQALKESSIQAKIKKLLVVMVILLGITFFQAQTAKLLPTLIQLFLMYFFFKTLIKGPPLIERFVRLEFSELPAEIVQYCRQLTVIWVVFFAFNALVCSLLAIWGDPSWWAIYSGVIIFALTVVLMIGEYIWRHYRFPDMEIPDIKTSAKNLAVNARQIWLDLYAE